MTTRYNVALILNVHKDYDRKITSGISRFASELGSWSLYLEDEPRAKIPQRGHWRGDGVIADLDETRVAPLIASLNVPFIGVGGFSQPELVPKGIPYVATDDATIGRLAAEHLIECGLRHFAYCGLPRSPYNTWSQYRQKFFVESLQKSGFSCSTYCGRYRSARYWEEMQNDLTKWLGQLETPLGMMTCDDPRGRHVMEACRRLGLRVPEDVAVLGVDNDLMMCELCDPPLSSIEQSTIQMGYCAATYLHQLMVGDQTDVPLWTIIPPQGVVQRRSTDILNVGDQIVAEALRFIRDHFAEGIQVGDVVRCVDVSRRTLDRAFLDCLSRTIHEELQRVRLNIAKGLLATGNLPLRIVAERTGYSNEQYFNHAFRRKLGQTPGQYRERHQHLPMQVSDWQEIRTP